MGIQNEAQKGAGGFSKFKQTIQSFRASQQAAPILTSQQVSSVSRSSSSIREQIPIVQTNELIINNQRSSSSEEIQQSADAEPSQIGSVEGTAGIDYPTYTRIPLTNFRCDGKPFTPGLYADEETGCQVFHVCFDGRRESFLCGVGTIFNQATLNCDYWYSVECSKSSLSYGANVDFGKRGEWQPSSNTVQQSSLSQNSFHTISSLARPSTSISSSSQRHESSSKNFIQVAVQPQIQRFESSSFVSSSSLGGKVSRPKSRPGGAFASSPAGIGRFGSSAISEEQQQSSDNGLLESKVKRVRVSINESSLTDGSPQNARLEEPMSPGQDVWKPIFKSKSNTNAQSTASIEPMTPSTPLQTTQPPEATIIEPSIPVSRGGDGQPAIVGVADEEPKFEMASLASPPPSERPTENSTAMVSAEINSNSPTPPPNTMMPTITPSMSSTIKDIESMRMMVVSETSSTEAPTESSSLETSSITTTTKEMSNETLAAESLSEPGERRRRKSSNKSS